MWRTINCHVLFNQISKGKYTDGIFGETAVNHFKDRQLLVYNVGIVVTSVVDPDPELFAGSVSGIIISDPDPA